MTPASISSANDNMRLNVYVNAHEQATFDTGYEARGNDAPKQPPEKYDTRLSHWWLAGWNTRDQELT